MLTQSVCANVHMVCFVLNLYMDGCAFTKVVHADDGFAAILKMFSHVQNPTINFIAYNADKKYGKDKLLRILQKISWKNFALKIIEGK